MFEAALSGSLKRLVYSQHFFDGDTSWIPDEQQAIEYIPVYDLMFNRKYNFVRGDLDKEDLDMPNNNVSLCQQYLKPNPYQNEDKHVVSSWILGSNTGKQHHSNKVIKAQIFMENVIDLGDSRYFKNIQEVMYKIKLVQQAKCYIGSPTSWDVIARWYSKPVIRIWPFE